MLNEENEDMFEFAQDSTLSVAEYIGADVSDTSDVDKRIEDYKNYCIRHFKTMEPWLPSDVKTIVDIGAGIGGIDIFVCRALSSVVDLHVMDGDGTQEQLHGYHLDTKAWADRYVAFVFIGANTSCNVFAHESDPNMTIETDLIMSLKSWGFHYPVFTYLGFAQRSLRQHGRIIMDLRTGRNGLEDMKRGGFHCIGRADYDSSKCERLIFERM